MLRLSLLLLLFLTSCKAAKPELVSLVQSTSPGSTSPPVLAPSGSGRFVVGSDQVGTPTPQYNVRGRVSAVPQEVNSVTPSFKVTGHANL
jgi:hypothetical protein